MAKVDVGKREEPGSVREFAKADIFTGKSAGQEDLLSASENPEMPGRSDGEDIVVEWVLKVRGFVGPERGRVDGAGHLLVQSLMRSDLIELVDESIESLLLL